MNHCFDMIVSQARLDKAVQTPLYQQLGDCICELWELGNLQKDQKLPPIRKLAEALGVNNVTVVNAYKYLENKKIAYSVVGSGTYISELTIGDRPVVSEGVIRRQRQIGFQPDLRNEEFINFAKSSVPTDLFPVDEFKLLFNAVLDRDKGDAFGYEQIQGYLPLRKSLCSYVAGMGIQCDADRVQVISGAQQGIDIVAKAMLSVGDVVLTESPTYYGAAGAFISRGAKVVEVSLENDGMDLNKLAALIKLYKPKLLYIMPYFQTPTCINTSLNKKRKILELANKYNFYIIEEDNQSEFSFDGEVIPLKALDYKNKVIYIKSFSKILMPGLRLGFMVLPKNVLERVLSAKYTTDIETSGFLQRAFHLFLDGESWGRHIEKMRAIFRKRYEAMERYSQKYLMGKLEYNIPAGGLNFWYELPPDESSDHFCNKLILNNVVVYPGSVFSLDGRDLPYIRLSFANVDENRIEEGLKRIAETVALY